MNKNKTYRSGKPWRKALSAEKLINRYRQGLMAKIFLKKLENIQEEKKKKESGDIFSSKSEGSRIVRVSSSAYIWR